MVMFAACAAAFLYLIPVAVVTYDWARRRNVPATSLALAIPNVVALDLLAIMFFTLFLRLDVAILCTRAVWVLIGTALVLRRGTTARALVREIDWPMLGAVLGAAGLALYMSLDWSRVYSVWDRFWHIPLVASIRGQQLPFRNVYYSTSSLHYHFSGDVLAASLQALSFDVIHADHALSLAHDLMFALTGACLGLLLWGFGHRSFVGVMLGVLAVLLNGPVSFLRGAGAADLHGFSVLNFFTMSFRPHVSIAGLLFVGFFGAVILHLHDQVSEHSETGPFIFRGSITLLITTALLGITDETSTGLLGLALGTTWLANAAIVHKDRRRGLLLLVGLLVAFVGVNLLYGGSLAPGGPVSTMGLVPWRSSGYFKPPIELASSEGRRLLVFDVLAIPAAFVGLLLLCWPKENVGRLRTVLLFLLVLNVSSLFGLTRIDVNGEAKEAHRFATAALFAAPLFALAWLPRAAKGSVAKLVLLSALLLPALSTASWYRNAVPQELAVELRPQLGTVNCREEADARPFEKAHPTYVSGPAWYVWSGCRPILSTGSTARQWSLPIFGPQLGLPALEIFEKNMLGAKENLRVICAPEAKKPDTDPVCAFAVERGACRMVTAKLQKCLVSPADRPALLSALGR
jgi:hypothetical protein